MIAARSGQIVTFYSYKGGSGRTMALANVGWILAANGKRVLLIDWDLEAPGLHRYLAPFLADPTLARTEGLVDWAYEYLVAATEPPDRERAPREGADWYKPYAAMDAYARPVEWQFPGDGCLHFVGAGVQGLRYAERVNKLNWLRFYEEYGGKAFVDAALAQAREQYDYVLIDSRTGVADTSGICTIQAPDTLVVLFTLNNQSIQGASEVVAHALATRNAGEAPCACSP